MIYGGENCSAFVVTSFSFVTSREAKTGHDKYAAVFSTVDHCIANFLISF